MSKRTALVPWKRSFHTSTDCDSFTARRNNGGNGKTFKRTPSRGTWVACSRRPKGFPESWTDLLGEALTLISKLLSAGAGRVYGSGTAGPLDS